MINSEEYIILKNLNKNIQKWYIVRDKDNKLTTHQHKPKKYIYFGIWSSNDTEIVQMYITLLFNENIFKTIKWSDDDPKTIKDYIEEYKRFKSNNEV